MIQGIKKLIKGVISLCVTLILIGLCCYTDARYIEPRILKKEKITLKTDKINSPKTLKIIQLGDVHLGKYYTVDQFQKVVEKINQEAPDLIIFTGDLIDDNKTFQDEEGAVTVLSQLKSRYGNFAVYGNHDHGSNGTRRYARIMKDSGFTLLRDGWQSIFLEGQGKLTIIGIDDVVLGQPDMEKVFKQAPKDHFRLFVSHAPDVADEAFRLGADLQLSGHTHGGQVRLPFIGAPFTPPYGKKYIKGLYKVGGEMPLYVTAGIGTSQLPYRFMNIPAFTVISLEMGTKGQD